MLQLSSFFFFFGGGVGGWFCFVCFWLAATTYSRFYFKIRAV